ncbi:MAG: class I SAM-dependent methyltransferase [Spirochaetes bacterium]|nr:class I SAM-dependent methyltransferase [Spirochaetota bacterium]
MSKSSDLTNYDNIAHLYIAHANRQKSWNNLFERPFMTSLFDDFSFKNVLDAGCGTGYYSFYALQQQANVTAVDASQVMLDHLKKKDFTGRIKCLQADMAKGLPDIDSDSQDYIISSLALHYIEDWNLIMNDFFRVLKEQGKAYISLQHPIMDFLYFQKESYYDKYLITDTWGKGDAAFRVHYYTRSLTDMLKPIIQSPFHIIKLEEPLPDEKCQELDNGVYQILMKQPAFLFIVVQKND